MSVASSTPSGGSRQLRILYHHRTLGDGAEAIHIREMTAAFRRIGHVVKVLGPGVKSATGRRSQQSYSVRSWLSESFVQAAALAYNAVDFASVIAATASFRPDIMYKRHGRYDVGAIEAATLCRIPTVLEVNAVYSASPYRDFEPLLFPKVARRLEKRALTLSNTVVAVSTPLRRQIEMFSGRTAIVVPNGADPVRFDPTTARGDRIREQYQLGGQLVIGWAGVIRHWHGLERLMYVLRGLPDSKLLIIGDGPARREFEEAARRFGLTDRIIITGRVPHDEVPDYLAAVDIAVVVADGTGVASPMKLLEYMAMGRCVIAPAIENVAEVIENGTEGLLFDPADPNSIMSAITTAAKDVGLRQRLGQNARSRIKAEHNWQNIATAVLTPFLK